MSRFRHAVKDRDQHIQTLRIACAVLAFFLLFTCAGWMLAPSKLTVHNPPDLRTGSTRPRWEVPPPTVYSFAFYIFQQLNARPKNGEVDYSGKINALSPYLTPSCQDFLKADAKKRGDAGELTDRVRVVYEVPGRGYQSQSVTVQDRDHWIARPTWWPTNISMPSRSNAPVRYPLKVVRWEGDAERNPFGLALDCYAGVPQRLEAAPPAPKPEKSGVFQ